MTTLSFVAGLIPLLIATGPGAEERRSIAVLAVGGQTLSLLLTLLAIPVLYTFFDDLSAFFTQSSREKQAAPQLQPEHNQLPIIHVHPSPAVNKISEAPIDGKST